MVKLRVNLAGNANGDGIGPTIVAETIPVNDFNSLWAYAQAVSKGFLTYPKLFRRYKINGVMAKWTIFQTGNDNPQAPLMAFMQPYSAVEGVPTSNMRVASALKQQRWTKWGYVRNWAQGGGPSTIKQFFGMRKMSGNSVQDLDYAGITDVTGNPYQALANQWWLVTGVTSVGENALGVSVGYEYNLELTYYVEYYEQVREQQSL